MKIHSCRYSSGNRFKHLLTCLQAFTAGACDDLEDFPMDVGGGSDSVTNIDDDAVEATTVEGELMRPMADLDMDNEESSDASS